MQQFGGAQKRYTTKRPVVLHVYGWSFPQNVDIREILVGSKMEDDFGVLDAKTTCRLFRWFKNLWRR